MTLRWLMLLTHPGKALSYPRVRLVASVASLSSPFEVLYPSIASWGRQEAQYERK